MKNLVRLVTAAAVLGSALVLAGCSTRTAGRPQLKVVEEFTVVESSTTQELTPAQLADLRQAVINYLQEQGLANNRIYYVRVTFPAANPGEEPQWAVVRIGNMTARTFTVLAAYPGADDYYPYDYYRTGYTGGYAGFSRWGYYDPFDFNYGYYSGRPVPPRDHGRPDKPDYKPDDKPKPPHGTPTRWSEQPRYKPYQPRDSNPDRSPRDRADNHGGHSRPDPGGGRTYSPPPERSYSPPPPPASATVERVQSSNSGIQQATSTDKEK